MQTLLNRIVRLLRLQCADGKGFSSANYWDNRYEHGGNSGPGSYGRLADFKARVLNEFVANNDIYHVIEFGCGDGNQLRLSKYPKYTGFDVSVKAVEMCKKIFVGDPSKDFFLLEDYRGDKADLSLSLDVIFHLVEDEVYEQYLSRLFESSSRYVIIYSSDADSFDSSGAAHVRHRNFTKWVSARLPAWKLIRKVENEIPYNGDYKSTSFCDFYIYEKKDG